MNRRSYRQYCPLAYALDVLGERWTLLVVRELMLGPRRFTDVANALPGIGANLLARRLRTLEDHAVIRRQRLPPPAASTVYELTERGHTLLPALEALAHWGGAYLQVPVPTAEYIGTVQMMGSLKMLFAATGVTMTCELSGGPETFAAIVESSDLRLIPGPHPEAGLRLCIRYADLYPLLGRPESAAAALEIGTAQLLAGEPDVLGSFLAQFQPLPETAVSP